MSLFGDEPVGETPSASVHSRGRSLFDDEPASKSSSSLFADDDVPGVAGGSPWEIPTPRKQQSRADLVRNLLPSSDVPDDYIDAFDKVLRSSNGRGDKIGSDGLGKVFAAARISAEQQAKILAIVAPAGGEVVLGRNEFHVLLALVGLVQEGETVSLDGVDERRKNLPRPKLTGINSSRVVPISDLAAKPPQNPVTPSKSSSSPPPKARAFNNSTMDYPDNDADPWNTPDMHKGHNHNANHSVHQPPKTNGTAPPSSETPETEAYTSMPTPAIAGRSVSNYASVTPASGTSGASPARQGGTPSTPSGGGWGYFEGNSTSTGFNDAAPNNTTNPFEGNDREPGGDGPRPPPSMPRAPSSGRTGNALEENVTVVLMPEKEGMFMFQHHNYEVTSTRRGSKVVRRYSDFVWLLDCLHKRYPFRVLPLLPPKRVAVNGNHLSNDAAFMEKRRRGLARFLNALVRHPVLSQETLVGIFLTVPTELAVWRKQATIQIQEEFDGRALPNGLEDSLPRTLEDLFDRTRAGIKRSSELYINICSVMDRLARRAEGVSADHGRLAASIESLTQVSADVYATDTNEVPLLNDGLTAMNKHLRSAQQLMEEESKVWEQGVLEDLKRQRDALVSVKEMFERRDRLDRDNIPQLERRIQKNEKKLEDLRAKPAGMVKPGEIEKVTESIIKDKQSIVSQHNRAIFVKECIRDELIYFQTTQYHVSRWNQDWAQERVKFAELLADNWRRLMDELEGMPLGD